MNIKLKNQHILVTGGSRGIGKAIVYSLVESGAKVAVHYFKSDDSVKKIESDLGSGVEFFKADLGDAMEVNSLFNEVKNKFPKIDAIVNNAGVAIGTDIKEEEVKWLDNWIKTMDVNLNAVGLLCKKAINHFLETGGGRIVNIASRAAHRGDTPEYMAYAASKGGVIAITKTIARAYGKQGIRAFTVAPGFVRTDMTQMFIKQFGDELVSRGIKLEHMTEPEDIAHMVTFLLSGFADHATGQTFDVNGGSYVR